MNEPKYGYAMHVYVNIHEKDGEISPAHSLQDIRDHIRECVNYSCGVEGMSDALLLDDDLTDDFVKRAVFS